MKVEIIGKGNVGSHLFSAFKNSDVDVSLINSRTLEGLSSDANLILLTVSDTAIPEVIENLNLRLPKYKGIVAHTAGSISIKIFSSFFKNFGVFYPLQTFSKDIPLSEFKEIPIFIEGNNEDTIKNLKQYASLISNNVWILNSDKREKLHIASVFLCNFVNAIYSIGEDILNNENLPFELTHPLIKQTALKILNNSPSKCQTGPAKRGDLIVIKKHIESLQDKPEIQSIYQLISNYIISKYQNEQN